MSKYEEDKKRLEELEQQYLNNINTLENRKQEARDNLMQIRGKLDYIRYREEQEQKEEEIEE